MKITVFLAAAILHCGAPLQKEDLPPAAEQVHRNMSAKVAAAQPLLKEADKSVVKLTGKVAKLQSVSPSDADQRLAECMAYKCQQGYTAIKTMSADALAVAYHRTKEFQWCALEIRQYLNEVVDRDLGGMQLGRYKTSKVTPQQASDQAACIQDEYHYVLYYAVVNESVTSQTFAKDGKLRPPYELVTEFLEESQMKPSVAAQFNLNKSDLAFMFFVRVATTMEEWKAAPTDQKSALCVAMTPMSRQNVWRNVLKRDFMKLAESCKW
ncbi:MAG: hypothetical protein HW383_674 [Candidatus Magasanikbacteria bacterium]|nr:hypothetical protein [Candidatus Magasanikbacteria bacterium]